MYSHTESLLSECREMTQRGTHREDFGKFEIAVTLFGAFIATVNKLHAVAYWCMLMHIKAVGFSSDGLM